ncbi:hypothetical protein HanRHA438_Chr06g0280161 [Helianthus annuus]|nr:hypothetical protein HanRHA438_Chr06g0280161 [Helianthus annuus]
MGDGKGKDIRVSILTSLFCIFVVIGGVFLVLYFCDPRATHPWFAVAAILFIGSPWIFWVLTYMYMCTKASGLWLVGSKGSRTQDARPAL